MEGEKIKEKKDEGKLEGKKEEKEEKEGKINVNKNRKGKNS